MKITRRRIVQLIIVLLVEAVTLLLMQTFMSGITVDSFRAAFFAAIVISIAQAIFWIVFIEFFAWLPTILYPLLTFFLNGLVVMLVANRLVPGIEIDSIWTAIGITIILTVVNAILGEVLSLDEDSRFDRQVTQRMVGKFGKPTKSDVPGIAFLEIDGLGEALLRRAIAEGHMPTLKRWLDQGSHQITSWETDFTSQTGAMQTGILMGNNKEVPAYRWWDRATKRIIMSGNPKDAIVLEKQLSTGRGLLSDGGASRGNMFSGDATESMLTMSTVLDRGHNRGPGFYFFLFSPYVLARLISRFFIECIKEWWQAWQQKRRKDKYRVSARNIGYAFLRGFMGPICQDLATYAVISDVLRGVPAIYALYAGYDDLSHFAGMNSEESSEALHEIDRYFARIESALEKAPRPYHIVILSDHGQTLGLTFQNAYNVSLEGLVDALMTGSGDVYIAQGTEEAWDKLQVVLTEGVQEDSRTARLLRRAFKSKTEGDLVAVSPEVEDDKKAREKIAVVMGSGAAGLIYFTAAEERMTYEQIQAAYPDLIIGLVNHPGVGFVMVKSEDQGSLVMGKGGIYYLKDDKVEGNNPLAIYGENAARHLRRETSFSNCPDILVNTLYDPQTQEMCAFENQVSHHGGMGGPQNHAFVMHPASLKPGAEPIVTAEGLYRVLRGWRDQVQSIAAAD